METATKWREDLKTVRGQAAIFAKILNREYERRGKIDVFVLDTWKRVQTYLPNTLLIKKKGKVRLQNWFRKCLRQYGWNIRIDNKYGIFEVTKKF